jgi:adhesin transport system outer membrane protein
MPPAPAVGQPTDLAPVGATLDIGRAVAAAVAWHPVVRNAAGSVLEAGDYVQVARAGYLPQVSAGISSGYNNRNLTGYDARRAHRANISVSQMLYDFGKVGSEVERAQAQKSAAQARVLMAVDDLARDTAQAWVEVRRYDQLQAIAREQKLAVSEIADLVRQRRAKGASALSDQTQAQAREDNARAFELEVGAQLMRWRTQLRHLTGMDAGPRADGKVPASMQDACLTNVDDVEPPAVLLARAEVRAARANRDNATAQGRPTLSLNASVSHGLDEESRRDEPNDSSVLLNVSAPLYQGGGNRARQRAAGHAIGAAEAALDHAVLSTSQRLQDARAQAAGNMQRMGVLADRVESLARTRTLYRQQYLDLGTRSLLDLLNAEQEYQQARMERTNNQYDLWRMQVDCLHGTARLREVFALDVPDLTGVDPL